MHVQELIVRGELSLCWSFVLDYENGENPFAKVRNRVNEWKHLAHDDCELSEEIAIKAAEFMKRGLRQMDASHVACAIFTGAKFFLTTDKKVLNKPITEITVINPIDFLRRHLSDD